VKVIKVKRRLKRAMGMTMRRVKNKGKRPNNIRSLKKGMTLHRNQNHKHNTHILR